MLFPYLKPVNEFPPSLGYDSTTLTQSERNSATWFLLTSHASFLSIPSYYFHTLPLLHIFIAAVTTPKHTVRFSLCLINWYSYFRSQFKCPSRETFPDPQIACSHQWLVYHVAQLQGVKFVLYYCMIVYCTIVNSAPEVMQCSEQAHIVPYCQCLSSFLGPQSPHLILCCTPDTE